MNNQKLWHGHAAMLACNILWGLMAPVSKEALNYFHSVGVSPFVLPAMRMIGATVCFWILSLFSPHEHTTWREKGMLVIAGLLSIAFNQNLFIVGVSFTSPIDASVVTTMLPIATMILAAIVIGEPITHLKAIGVAIGMGGALLLIFSNGGALSTDADHIKGDLMCLTAQVSFACYLVFFKKLIARFSPVTLMKWMFLFSTILSVPTQIGELSSIDYSQVPVEVYGEVFYVVFCGTFLTFLMVPVGQKMLRPTTVSSYNYVQPVVSTIVSLYLGLSQFNVMKGLAIALVFIGVYIVTQSKSRQQLIDEGKIK